MGFERVALFAIIEFDYAAVAGASCAFLTDLPGNAMAVRGPALALPVAATRRTVKLRLLGTIKGKKYRVIVSAPGLCILYGGRVFARPLGPSDAAWAWYPLPIQATANEFTEFKLPIDATAETYSEVPLPLHPTPAVSDWVDVPVAK